MKKAMLFLLVVISLFACVSTVFAKDASEMIGTITSYVEEIQKYPEALRDACGTDMFKQKLSELANLITGANDAMMEAGLPNTLNLWAVYSAVTSHSSDCSFFESALSKADWSREELDRIGYKYGLYDDILHCRKIQIGWGKEYCFNPESQEVVGKGIKECMDSGLWWKRDPVYKDICIP